MKQIVIVGGGAGGLELATHLGRSLGKKGFAEITLVDANRVHLWKPLLHEVASGSLDTGREALSYRAHSAENGYYFRLGRMTTLDKKARTITLAPWLDHHQKEVLAERTLSYDYLVMAVGARCNDFGMTQVREHCYTLDSAVEAEDFHQAFLNRFLQYSEQADALATPAANSPPVHIAIVGAGATGVELAAELRQAVERLEAFGLKSTHSNSLKISLIEATQRILPALPEHLADKARQTLVAHDIDILTNTMIKDIEANLLVTADSAIEADMIVWAAGVKAPAFLAELDLPTNRIHQIEVDDTLRVQGEDRIFAIGDCAALMQGQGESARPVPALAQAAHQMAEVCARNLEAVILSRQTRSFVYEDHGALISLSDYQTVGGLMHKLFKKPWFIEGRTAHLAYNSLYRQHQLTLHGRWKMLWILLTAFVEKRVKPALKVY